MLSRAALSKELNTIPQKIDIVGTNIFLYHIVLFRQILMNV